MPQVDTREDRVTERARLDALAKNLITGEYERTIEVIENFDPDAEGAPDINRQLEYARNHLADLDHIDGQRDLCPESLDLNGDIPQRQWLIKNWLPANCLSMITGAGGVGKSYAALQIAAALTNGVTDDLIFKSSDRETLDIERGINHVVYAAWEDDRDEVRRRLRRIAKTLKWVELDQLAERFTFIDMKGHGPIWGPEFQSPNNTRANMLTPGHQLTRICEDKGAALLILDPGAGAFGSDENDRAAVREYTAHLSHWGNEHSCATLILAHPPKSGESYSGSTDWLGSVRSMWEIGLRKDTEGKDKKEWRYYSIRHEKANYSLEQPERFMRKAENSGIWIEVNSRNEANLIDHNSTQEDSDCELTLDDI